MADRDYWQRFQCLKLCSLQRYRERFIILHCWKIYLGLAPNDVGLTFFHHIRFGLQCKRRPLRSKRAKIPSIRLLNILPSSIKQKPNLATFKAALDQLLSKVPEHPLIAGYPCINHNSLTELASYLREEVKVTGYSEVHDTLSPRDDTTRCPSLNGSHRGRLC